MIRNLTAAIFLLASNAAFSQLSKSVMERFTCDVEDVEFIQVFQIPDITPDTGKPFVVTEESYTTWICPPISGTRQFTLAEFRAVRRHLCRFYLLAKAYGSFFVINKIMRF